MASVVCRDPFLVKPTPLQGSVEPHTTSVPKYSGRTTGTTCRTGGTTPLQIYLNRPRPFGPNRLAYGPLEHIERFRMMGGWPMGVRFMGHTTCPHVRAVAATTQTMGCVVHRKWLKQLPTALVAYSSEGVRGQRRHGNPRHHANT